MSRKPIIGLSGGVGSGKSTVARMMGELGGRVIDADAIAHQMLQRPDVRGKLLDWWGPGILNADGLVDRKQLADRVFHDPEPRRRLEGLIHPLVRQERERRLQAAMTDPSVRFIVEDVPLLFEAGLDAGCDFTVFVDAPEDLRLRRVAAARGWDRGELERREKNQWALDKKRDRVDAIIRNDGEEPQCLAQVRSFLDRIL